MTLQAFALICIGLALLFCLIIAMYETEMERRKQAVRRVRELHAENAKLRAKLNHKNYETQYELDEVKTALAVKDLLLRQKWNEVKR